MASTFTSVGTLVAPNGHLMDKKLASSSSKMSSLAALLKWMCFCWVIRFYVNI